MTTTTLLWINRDDTADRAQEDFTSERELCQRIVALAEQRPELTFSVGTILGGSSWVNPEGVAQRLALIDARREAVALELLVQDKATSASWTRIHGQDPEAYWVDMLMPWEREELLARADRLIAAYTGVAL